VRVGLSYLAEGDRTEALEWFTKSIGEAQSAQREGLVLFGMHGLAAVYAHDDPRLAARLRGCALTLAQRLGIDIEEPDAGVAGDTDRTLRAELGDEYEDLLAEGARLTPADLLDVALPAGRRG
jgi:hypothetical protein